jgi:lipase maturation factor 1
MCVFPRSIVLSRVVGKMSPSSGPTPSDRPLMIFDGDCEFCRAIVERWRQAVGQEIDFAPYQQVGATFAQIDDKAFQRAVHLVETGGRVSRGAEAVFRAMAHCGRKRGLLWLYLTLPLFAFTAESIYRLVAANRTPIAAIRRIWYGKSLQPPAYHIASALYLRLLGAVYLIAFVSLWTQIDGLVGDRGILPVKNYLEAVEGYLARNTSHASPIWSVPTLAWISPHDLFLNLLCAAGTILSVVLILGLLPIPSLIALWLLYLSLVHAGQVFLSFQWDILLLEAGFVAIFLAPFVFRSRFLADPHPPRIAVWLIWWLLFRLMLESGAVKLTWNRWELGPDGSPLANTWASLTALDFHYWTQPLPIWTSWYAAKSPEWFQKLSVVFLFLVELGSPWLIFGPRRLRHIACGGISLLMLLIAITGNYNFFNLLAIVLAMTLLDDAMWPSFLQCRISGTDWPWLASPTRWRSFLLMPFAGLAILIGARQLKEAIAPAAESAPSLESRLGVSQFFLVNGYGLFRDMTETRPEILIDGSVDGKNWKTYEFLWKPGDPSRRPRLCSPHQPRLDWQMWFEALRFEQVQKLTGTIEPREMSPWFRSFLTRLMTGELQVLDLLANNPFPAGPPKFVRVSLDQYRFTTSTEGRATGDWWHREPVWVGAGWSLTQ